VSQETETIVPRQCLSVESREEGLRRCLAAQQAERRHLNSQRHPLFRDAASRLPKLASKTGGRLRAGLERGSGTLEVACLPPRAELAGLPPCAELGSLHRCRRC
jgi:hypothetical protein